jgi:hypothetical protein
MDDQFFERPILNSTCIFWRFPRSTKNSSWNSPGELDRTPGKCAGSGQPWDRKDAHGTGTRTGSWTAGLSRAPQCPLSSLA